MSSGDSLVAMLSDPAVMKKMERMFEGERRKRKSGSRNLGEALHDEEIHVAEVVQHDDKIMIPKDMSIDDVIANLKRHQEHLLQEISINRRFDAFPWDGAKALQQVLAKRYGWVPATHTTGMFGSKNPPQTVSVEVAYGKTEQVPWGRFELPDAGIKGWIQCESENHEGRWKFAIYARVQRQGEAIVEQICKDIEAELKQGSIYHGKAIKIRFRDDGGDTLSLPQINFMPVTIQRENLIYSREIEEAIETNLFTPITRAIDCIKNGIPVKRGVLLGGPYGVGKTLAAGVAATLASEHGVTFLYVPRADELADAVAFARQYANPACAIFCEDIDRVVDGERDIEMDDILNIIDGIDGKDSNILIVLTTNHLDHIHPAMLRPGRLDAVISIEPPDAEAAQRLVRYYGGNAIPKDLDLHHIGTVLEGKIPAVIAEVVKRAKLAQLRLSPPGEKIDKLSAEALLEAARTMDKQMRLITPRAPTTPPPLEAAMQHAVRQAFNGEFEKLQGNVNKIWEKVESRL